MEFAQTKWDGYRGALFGLAVGVGKRRIQEKNLIKQASARVSNLHTSLPQVVCCEGCARIVAGNDERRGWASWDLGFNLCASLRPLVADAWGFDGKHFFRACRGLDAWKTRRTFSCLQMDSACFNYSYWSVRMDWRNLHPLHDTSLRHWRIWSHASLHNSWSCEMFTVQNISASLTITTCRKVARQYRKRLIVEYSMANQ